MSKFKNPEKTPVLVVDDMSLGRLSAKNLLQQSGFQNIHLASNGLEAWNKLIESEKAGQAIELVLCDWIMPDMNGIELLKKMKTKQWSHFPPVILVTAETDLELIQQAIHEGAAGYVAKPLTLESLKTALKKLDSSGS